MRPPGSIALALALAALPLDAAAQAPARPSRSYAALATADGVRITLYRYLPAGGPGRGAVVLLPDVGTTHRLFDLDGQGLALALQADGWEVWTVDWRGTGRSEVPFGGYCLEDLLGGDAEAVLGRALAAHEKVAVGGVGLGATLALALAARHPQRVSAVVALQPLVAPDVPGEAAAAALARFEQAPPWIDLGALSNGLLFHGRTWFEVLLANDGTLAPDRWTSVRLHVLAPVPRRLAGQIAQAVQRRELVLDGRPVADLIRGWRGPTVLVFAPRDNWIHPEFSVQVRGALAQDRCRVHVLDKLAGLRQDYGHLGMLLGRYAPEEVFAPVLKDLAEVTR